MDDQELAYELTNKGFIYAGTYVENPDILKNISINDAAVLHKIYFSGFRSKMPGLARTSLDKITGIIPEKFHHHISFKGQTITDEHLEELVLEKIPLSIKNAMKFRGIEEPIKPEELFIIEDIHKKSKDKTKRFDMDSLKDLGEGYNKKHFLPSKYVELMMGNYLFYTKTDNKALTLKNALDNLAKNDDVLNVSETLKSAIEFHKSLFDVYYPVFMSEFNGDRSSPNSIAYRAMTKNNLDFKEYSFKKDDAYGIWQLFEAVFDNDILKLNEHLKKLAQKNNYKSDIKSEIDDIINKNEYLDKLI